MTEKVTINIFVESEHSNTIYETSLRDVFSSSCGYKIKIHIFQQVEYIIDWFILNYYSKDTKDIKDI